MGQSTRSRSRRWACPRFAMGFAKNHLPVPSSSSYSLSYLSLLAIARPPRSIHARAAAGGGEQIGPSSSPLLPRWARNLHLPRCLPPGLDASIIWCLNRHNRVAKDRMKEEGRGSGERADYCRRHPTYSQPDFDTGLPLTLRVASQLCQSPLSCLVFNECSSSAVFASHPCHYTQCTHQESSTHPYSVCSNFLTLGLH